MNGILLLKESGRINTNFNLAAAKRKAAVAPDKYEVLDSTDARITEVKSIKDGTTRFLTDESALAAFTTDPINNYFDAREVISCDFVGATAADGTEYFFFKSHKALVEASDVFKVEDYCAEENKELEDSNLEKDRTTTDEQSNDANAPIEDKNIETVEDKVVIQKSGRKRKNK